MDKIKEIPTFKHEIDDISLSKMTEAEKYIVTTISEMKQMVRWGCGVAMTAHNLAVEHQRMIDNLWRKPVLWFFGMLLFFASNGIVALITVLVGNWLGSK